MLARRGSGDAGDYTPRMAFPRHLNKSTRPRKCCSGSRRPKIVRSVWVCNNMKEQKPRRRAMAAEYNIHFCAAAGA